MTADSDKIARKYLSKFRRGEKDLKNSAESFGMLLVEHSDLENAEIQKAIEEYGKKLLDARRWLMLDIYHIANGNSPY